MNSSADNAPLSFFEPLPPRSGTDTPPEGALSVTRGVGRKPIDFDWLDKNIPCQAACPAGTDIPGYLEAISRGDSLEAYRINLRDNVFPAVLGRVCTRPCEPACRHGWKGLGDPVAICFAKRSAEAFMQRQEPVLLEPIFPASGKRIAVIGAGAAGLAAARDLALFGHSVEVFEKGSEPGGLMIQGIPEFRLPREVVRREIEQIRLQGVQFCCDQAVETREDLERLRREFDAVLLAFGASKPSIPDLSGVESDGVQHGLTLLRNVHRGERPMVGDRVVVVGGGFTAVDCARMARRLGAGSVQMVYRRTEREMYIAGDELHAMKDEGIEFKTCLAPVSIQTGVEGLRVEFRETRPLKQKDVDGRAGFEMMEDSSVVIEADTVLLGTGQTQDWDWMEEDLRRSLLNGDGTETGLYMAGDLYSGPGSLIDAIGHARSIARRMDADLMGGERLEEVAAIHDIESTGRTRDMDEIPRQTMPERSVAERTVEAEVELGLPEDSAVTEAQRCYLCNIKFEIDNDLCIYCDRCLKVKPVEGCIVKISDLIHDEDGRITGYHPSKSNRDYNLLYIDQSQCIRCGACAEVCPVECIPLQKVSRCTMRKGD